jgi:import inner membrane translocase subunit TIM8
MSDAQKNQDQLMQLRAVVESQQMLVKLTAKCFEACVSSPGKDLSSSQQTCLWRCAQNMMEGNMFMQKRLLSKANDEQQHQH